VGVPSALIEESADEDDASRSSLGVGASEDLDGFAGGAFLPAVRFTAANWAKWRAERASNFGPATGVLGAFPPVADRLGVEGASTPQLSGDEPDKGCKLGVVVNAELDDESTVEQLVRIEP